MAQVFGNRILGGIGAPGGGMSEAFGAGVNTALNQRTARQSMVGEAQRQRMLEQEFAWKGEDREEAKRRAAAAAAAAASARARAATLNARLLEIYGGGAAPVAGLTIPGATAAPATARDRQGPAVAAPAPTAGVRTPVKPSPPLTFGGGAVSGGGGQTTVGGGTGVDVLGAPTQSRFRSAPIPAAGTPPSKYVPAERPGDFAAQATRDRTRAATQTYSGPQTIGGAARTLELAQYELEAAKEAFAASGSGSDLADVQRWTSEVERLTPMAADYQTTMQTYTEPRGVFALEGPESVTIQGPNGPVTVPTAVAPAAPATPTPTPAPAPTAQDLGLSMGTTGGQPGVPADVEGLGTAAGLTFGPRLGSTPQAQEEILAQEFVSRIGVDPTYVPPKLGTPGAPSRVITALLGNRDKLVQAAQAYIEAGDTGKAIELQMAIAAETTKIEAAVARQAIEEARDFNAPQRLSAIWSYNTSRQYEFQPSSGGGFDVYTDGELSASNVPMETISENTLLMADQAYAAAQSELAQMQAEAYAKEFGKTTGALPAAQSLAATNSALNVQEAEALALIEIDQDGIVKNNETTQKVIEYVLQQRGQLPTEGPKFEYQTTPDGGIAVFDGGALVVEYVPAQTVDTAGNTVVTLREVRQ